MTPARPQNPGSRETRHAVVFDASRREAHNPEIRSLGALVNGGSLFGAFRRTWRDRCGTPVTGKLLGDPAPDRVVPVIPAETRQGYREAEPAPVYLTFAAYEAATGRRVG